MKAKHDHRPFWTKRSTYLPLVIVLAVNVLVYAALTYRLATKQERLAREHATLTERVASERGELAALETERTRLVRNDETANAFWSDVVRPRDPGMTEAMAELDRLAAESGVDTGRISFSYEELDVGLEQVSASMPLEGDYFNLVRFINSLERSPTFYLVREIGLRPSSTGDAALGLRCDVLFFLKKAGDDEGETS
jgi:Tfp pilus assembly protein PilO